MVLFPVVNESCRVLEERMVLRASDIDVGAVLGYNWPAHRYVPTRISVYVCVVCATCERLAVCAVCCV